jgi:hypothetical protein
VLHLVRRRQKVGSIRVKWQSILNETIECCPARALRLRFVSLQAYMMCRDQFQFDVFCNYVVRGAVVFERVSCAQPTSKSEIVTDK